MCWPWEDQLPIMVKIDAQPLKVNPNQKKERQYMRRLGLYSNFRSIHFAIEIMCMRQILRHCNIT